MNELAALIVVIIVLLALLAAQYGMAAAMADKHAAERRDWTAERLMLVNRIIAKHTGEVGYLDNTQAPPKPQREHTSPPIAAGL